MDVSTDETQNCSHGSFHNRPVSEVRVEIFFFLQTQKDEVMRAWDLYCRLHMPIATSSTMASFQTSMFYGGARAVDNIIETIGSTGPSSWHRRVVSFSSGQCQIFAGWTSQVFLCSFNNRWFRLMAIYIRLTCQGNMIASSDRSFLVGWPIW